MKRTKLKTFEFWRDERFQVLYRRLDAALAVGDTVLADRRSALVGMLRTLLKELRADGALPTPREDRVLALAAALQDLEDNIERVASEPLIGHLRHYATRTRDSVLATQGVVARLFQLDQICSRCDASTTDLVGTPTGPSCAQCLTEEDAEKSISPARSAAGNSGGPDARAPVPRRKQDKFEILDSPREYAGDFPSSVGLLGASVVFFDLDDFKAVNTRFTEPVVDRTLLPALMRLVDSLAARRGFAYSEGGDEFVILLPNTNTVLAESFAAVLLERIGSTTFEVDGEAVRVTASAGIASSLVASDGQACREAASHAKREAKRRPGKGAFVTSTLRT